MFSSQNGQMIDDFAFFWLISCVCVHQSPVHASPPVLCERVKKYTLMEKTILESNKGVMMMMTFMIRHRHIYFPYFTSRSVRAFSGAPVSAANAH